MTTEDIITEFEALLAFRGNTLKTCPCGAETHASVCLSCGIKLTGDQTIDKIMKQIEEGKDVDLSQLDPKSLKATPSDTFVPLAPGEIP